MTWEDWDKLQEDYHLEDKVILQGPSDDSIVVTEVQLAESGAKQVEQEVQIASSTNRKILKPAYLKDYV